MNAVRMMKPIMIDPGEDPNNINDIVVTYSSSINILSDKISTLPPSLLSLLKVRPRKFVYKKYT